MSYIMRWSGDNHDIHKEWNIREIIPMSITEERMITCVVDETDLGNKVG